MTIIVNYMVWLTDIATGGHAKDCPFKKLFTQLMDTPFRWVDGIPLDENRANDGKSMRTKFIRHTGDTLEIPDDVPASVLEVMVALADRIEREIMHNGAEGDRTSIWFHAMVHSLGLDECTDDGYDAPYVNAVLQRFMTRAYDQNGAGGLFTISNPDFMSLPMPAMEIWQQANKWLMSEVIHN